jgi:oxygen-independent coproporphyrinogen-3 oxidase
MIKLPVAGIYISWPFCAQKCTYCNFASGVLPRELEGRYVAALLEEISAHNFSSQPDTVYLGGGTPSAMETDHLGRLLNALPSPWREATIEVAPGTITAARIDAWLRAGINRVSLGVQSFVRQELARTGRKHSAEIVVQDIALLRSKGLHAGGRRR